MDAAHAVVVRGTGETLPLRDGAVDGCRIERVLQHLAEPEAFRATITKVLVVARVR